MSEINTPEAKHAPHKSRLVIGYLVLALIAIFGTYFWQHQKYLSEVTKVNEASSKLNTSSQKLAGANKQIKSLNTTISSLSPKNLQAASPKATTEVTPSSLSLTVNGAVRYTPDALDTDKNAGVAVSITLKNDSSDTLSVSTSNYKLQDKDGNVYLVNGLQNNSLEQQYLPSSYVLLANQSLTHGQSVKGTIIFIVPNSSLTSFNLSDGTNTYLVNAQ